MRFFGDATFVVLNSTSGAVNSEPPTKSVYFVKWRLSHSGSEIDLNCPSLQTLESFWKLVSKDRFAKLKDFALKMHSMFGSLYVRVSSLHFLYCAGSQIYKQKSNSRRKTGRWSPTY